MDEPMLQFFAYDHLPERLRDVSEPFGTLAQAIVVTLPRNPERTVALRKLLEAKDCAVRAVLWKGLTMAGEPQPYWPWCASRAPRRTTTLAVDEVAFGDGYKHRATRGLNPARPAWTLELPVHLAG